MIFSFEKQKREITIVNAFQKKLASQTENQVKYGLIKGMTFTIIFLKGF